MHASGQTLSVDQSLKSSVHEFGDGQTQNVIQLVLVLVQESVLEPAFNNLHSLHQGGTFEESSGVLLVEGQELSRGLSQMGQSHLHSPHFSLVFQTVFTDDLHFLVQTLLLVGSSGSGGGSVF